MTYYIIYILTVIGMGYVLTLSDIAKPFRMRMSKINEEVYLQPFSWIFDKIDGVVNCIYCASFWIGMVVFYLMYGQVNRFLVLYAFSAMGAVYIIKTLFNKN